MVGTEPSNSPNCLKIFYASERTGDREIFVLDKSKNSIDQITHDGYKKHYPVLSPDQSHLAYIQDFKNEWYLAILNLNNRKVDLLTKTFTFNPVMPAWSSDSKKIFYSSNKLKDREIMAYDLISGQELNLTNSSGDDAHVFSYGGWIIFSSERDGSDKEIDRMKEDGSSVKRLTKNNYYDGHPSISQDSIIYFLSITKDKKRSFRSVDIDGKNLKIIKMFNTNIYYPKVCADGNNLTFVSEKEEDAELYNLNLSSKEVSKYIPQ